MLQLEESGCLLPLALMIHRGLLLQQPKLFSKETCNDKTLGGYIDRVEACSKPELKQTKCFLYEILEDNVDYSPTAAYMIAQMYFWGIRSGFAIKSKQKERLKAVDIFKEVAQAGVASAQYFYASLLESGEDVDQNTQLAVKFYKASAAQGHNRASQNLQRLVPNEVAAPVISKVGETQK